MTIDGFTAGTLFAAQGVPDFFAGGLPVVALWLVALWLGGLLFQIADLGTAWFDLRNARTSIGPVARRRAHELFWVAPTAALLALGLALSIDLVASLILDRAVLPVVGFLLALAVIVLVVSITVMAAVALLTRDIQSYALLRFKLGDVEARKLGKAEIIAWRDELAVIDEREGVRHERIARTLRLIPIGLAAAALIVVWVALVDEMSTLGRADGGLIMIGLVAILIPVASIVLAARSARLSLRARASWTLVNGKQRAELVKTLDELERRTGRGVAGLSDRVNRALQILREQQL